MSDLINQLGRTVSSRLRVLGFSGLGMDALQSLLEIAYLASMKTEEGRFVRGSITLADPAAPDNPPLLQRADYPRFTKFDRRKPLTVESLVKLARAIDRWSASIAVWGISRNGFVTWGVVDQLVQQNIRLNREGVKGFAHPGIITITMEGVGDLSVYHQTLFLGSLRGQRLVTSESDALRSPGLEDLVMPSLTPLVTGIRRSLEDSEELYLVRENMFSLWASTIARLCIGLRRLGTGGSFLITAAPKMGFLDVGYGFRYSRLGDALALKVLDDMYLAVIQEELESYPGEESFPKELSVELLFAEADAEDRESELGGAVKLVTSLASVDGLVLLTPDLSVLGFGVKIGTGPRVATVYDGPDFVDKGKQARKIVLASFGTRHTSMLRYCRLDPAAVGVVVSQDGHVRLIMTLGRSVTLWDNVKLLEYEDYSPVAARSARRWRKMRTRHSGTTSFGYTSMPKNVADLLAKVSKTRARGEGERTPAKKVKQAKRVPLEEDVSINQCLQDKVPNKVPPE